jgi:hypothetical protein
MWAMLTATICILPVSPSRFPNCAPGCDLKSPELGSWGHTKKLTDLLSRGSYFPAVIPRVSMYSPKHFRLLIYNENRQFAENSRNELSSPNI